MIPDKREIEDMQAEMRELIGLPDDWGVKIEVLSYLFYDMKYEIKKAEKTIDINIYSATFPDSYLQWHKNVAIEIANKLGCTPSPKTSG
jgi:hypothetical protein